MIFRNMEELNETSDDVAIWEGVTSEHVERYWNSRPVPPILVVDVSTEWIDQDPVIQRRRLEEGQIYDVISYFYRQNITFGFLEESFRERDQDFIFTEPFARDEADYVDALVVQLQLESNMIIVENTIIRESSSLSPSPAVPTISPSPTAASAKPPSSGTTVSTTVIVVIVIVFLFALVGALFGYAHYSKQQRLSNTPWTNETTQYSQEEPPYQIETFVNGEEAFSDDEEGSQRFTDDPNDSNFSGHNFEEEDPSPEPGIGPPSDGVLGDYSSEEEELPIFDPPHRISSLGSMDSDSPTFEAFQVTVFDIED
jgi:hypothetical protein